MWLVKACAWVFCWFYFERKHHTHVKTSGANVECNILLVVLRSKGVGRGACWPAHGRCDEDDAGGKM
jgi:hypothetical protein